MADIAGRPLRRAGRRNLLANAPAHVRIHGSGVASRPARGDIQSQRNPGRGSGPVGSERAHASGGGQRLVQAVAGTPRSAAGARSLAILRIGLGFIFLWAFLDKLFGLGLSTSPEKSVLAGGSPTSGYLAGLRGALAEGFRGLANQAWVDWLFMAGLLAVGIALIAGVALRAAAVGGGVLMVLMWLSALPLRTNPFVDDHLVYALVLVALALTNAGGAWGLGGWASRHLSPRARTWLS